MPFHARHQLPILTPCSATGLPREWQQTDPHPVHPLCQHKSLFTSSLPPSAPRSAALCRGHKSSMPLSARLITTPQLTFRSVQLCSSTDKGVAASSATTPLMNPKPVGTDCRALAATRLPAWVTTSASPASAALGSARSGALQCSSQAGSAMRLEV